MSDSNPNLEKLFDQELNETQVNALRDEIGQQEVDNQIQLQNKIEN